MRYARDPRQKVLFDPAEAMFSPRVLARLRSGWSGLFRAKILELMPVGKLGKHFHPVLGCPTKELYGMAGLIFLKEFFNLTLEQAEERYLFDASFQFALNVNPMEVSLGHATIERYVSLFAENDLARTIFDRVTAALVETLELNVSKQRLELDAYFFQHGDLRPHEADGGGDQAVFGPAQASSCAVVWGTAGGPSGSLCSGPGSVVRGLQGGSDGPASTGGGGPVIPGEPICGERGGGEPDELPGDAADFG